MAAPLAETTPDVVLKSVFKYYDADGSGNLSKEEFSKYLKSVGLDGNDFTEAIKALADDDNDGLINFEEFKNFIKKDNIQEMVNNSEEFEFLCTICDLFKQYDANGDGSISWEEWKDFMKKQGKTEEEAKELFTGTDKNDDKKITFDEFYHKLVDN